jgi:hypothetical protein
MRLRREHAGLLAIVKLAAASKLATARLLAPAGIEDGG